MRELMNADAAPTVEALVDPSGTPVVKISGELDLFSVGLIRAGIEDCVTGEPARMLLDLSELRFMDCYSLRMFLALSRQIPEVQLLDPSPIVRKVIELTGTSGAFVMTP